MRITILTFISIVLFGSNVFTMAQGVDAGVSVKKNKTVTPISKPRIISKKFSEISRANKISITARYPQVSGTSAADFNRLSLQIVKKEIADFKKDLDKPDRDTNTRSLDIGYGVSFVDNRIVSIGLGASKEWGGAHPYSYAFSLNYDLKENRELELGDLFKENSNYLNTISNYCIKRLKNKGVGDDEWIQNGAGDTPENYRNWLITKRGILITFNAYQVASYAEGPQEVEVPFSAVRNLIPKNSPLGNLIK